MNPTFWDSLKIARWEGGGGVHLLDMEVIFPLTNLPFLAPNKLLCDIIFQEIN